MSVVLNFMAFLFSLACHEAAHAYCANKLGDPTGAYEGRITLNPMAHIDPIGTVLLPLLMAISGAPAFGWAKPVPFNPMYFQNPRKGMMIVGLAGPLTNLILAVASALLLRLVGGHEVASYFLLTLCLINVALAVFNMIPVPPLDGSRVLVGLLPAEMVPAYLGLERYGFLIIIALLYTGLLNLVMSPVRNFILRVLL